MLGNVTLCEKPAEAGAVQASGDGKCPPNLVESLTILRMLCLTIEFILQAAQTKIKSVNKECKHKENKEKQREVSNESSEKDPVSDKPSKKKGEGWLKVSI